MSAEGSLLLWCFSGGCCKGDLGPELSPEEWQPKR